MELIEQAGIMLFGCTAVLIVGRKRESVRRWGYILGLIGQPFWAHMAWRTESWGVAVLVLWYTYSWGQGCWNHWRKAE